MILEIQRNGVQLHVFNLKGNDVVLGRGAESDCPINAEDISRLHCRIKFENGKYYIQDLKSSNGTFVYDEKIAPEKFHEFLPEFPVKLGKSVLVFVRKMEPLQDIASYEGTNPGFKINQSAKTQVFTGILKKDALKKNRPEGKSFNAVLIAPLLIIGAITSYYFLFYRKNEPTLVEVKAEVVSEAMEPVSADPVLSQMPKTGCIYDDEKRLCTELELNSGDYISFHNSEVNIVVDLERWIEKKSSDLSSLSDTDKKRFILFQLINKAHSSLELASFSTSPRKLRLFATSSDYQKLNTIISFELEGPSSHNEISEALSAAISSGGLSEFDTKFGQFFKTEEIK